VNAGMTQSQGQITETPDYIHFKARVRAKTGIDLDLYKQQQMHRRLLGLVERVQAKDFADYYQLLERDPQEYALFLDRLTINVSELFRNPEKWTEMREKILLPALAKKRSLKVWSAGCSYGAEPYSLAILLDQIAPGGSHTIHASDLDRNILARAKEGKFTQSDVKNLEPATLARYFTRLTPESGLVSAADTTPAFQVKPEVRARVTFRPHNLLADKFESGYDLVCCRNVVIYFTDTAKEKLYMEFYRSLAPGGVLFVGGTERIFNYQEVGFSAPAPFFYRRDA
jgi:chemotaxis protein methyltransferase CheR